jgi:hypothetical protein
MSDESKKPPKSKRVRTGHAQAGKTTDIRKVAKGMNAQGRMQEYASAGKYTTMTPDGRIADDVGYRNKIRNMRGLADSLLGGGTDEFGEKTAGLFNDGGVGYADIADSNNIGYYSYEFPVDALELPASRAEELRFYRLAYDRDPIVGRAIDMHTELPLSKMESSKPKCSSEEFADYVFDEFQRFQGRTRLFQTIIDACREYWTIGEAFIWVEKPDAVEPCNEAQKIIDQENGVEGADGAEPGKESQFHSPMGGTSSQILDYVNPSHRGSWLKNRSTAIDAIKKAGVKFDVWEGTGPVTAEIKAKKAALNKKTREAAKAIGVPAKSLAKLIIASEKDKGSFVKLGKLLSRTNGEDAYPIQVTADSKTAAPPAAPAAPAAPAPAADAGGGMPPGADPMAAEGAPMGDAGLGDIAGAEGAAGGDPMGGGGGAPMGGGGGGGMSIAPDMAGEAQGAIAMGVSVTSQRELMELKHYLRLLERKKELLEELQEVRENREEEMELFTHVVNREYDGPTRIQILPPEQIDLANDGNSDAMGGGATIYYKPPQQQKQAYLEDPDVPSEVKEKIQLEGKIPLNQDPMKGSYVIHFARKKSGYELHGRSILQRCIRTVIYREKLRQVQSTLASRNMTPKSLIIAPGIPANEVVALRAHVDEAKADPDYSVVLNYEARWDEIGSEGRLLALDGEWNHTNSDLAIGMGLSPEILIGEGMYSGNRIQLQIMETSYLQFRDLLTSIIEDQIFKPIAMERGFYEMDKYGRPRWIYPKVSFSRMALRDSGDLYDMLFNLYSKGSLPIDIIYEFLSLDPEDCERKLEDNLFTVKDSKFNEMLSNIYNSVGEWLMTNTDLGKRITKGLQLEEVDQEPEGEGPEGSGEGV